MDGRNGRVGVMLRRDLPREQVIPFTRGAEELGFDELWIVEDLGFRGGIAQAATALASTSSITVGIGLLPAGARNAAFAAMELATLAELFPGRLVAGVGHGMPGWMRSVGAWPASPMTLLEEYIVAVRTLLRGGRLETGDARYVTVDDVALETVARPPVVPAVLAGVRGPRSLALSGRVADGTILAEPAGPEYVRASLAHIAPTRPHAMVSYNIGAVDPDATVAIDAARPGLAWIGEADWSVHIDPLPFAAELSALRADCGSREEFAARLPAEWVARLAIAGTAADVRARNEELFAAGVTTSVLTPVGDDAFSALESLATAL